MPLRSSVMIKRWRVWFLPAVVFLLFVGSYLTDNRASYDVDSISPTAMSHQSDFYDSTSYKLPRTLSNAELADLLAKSPNESGPGNWRCVNGRFVTGDSTSAFPASGSSCVPSSPTLQSVLAARTSTVYSSTGVDCKAVFSGDPQQTEVGVRFTRNHPKRHAHPQLTNGDIMKLTRNCTQFRRSRGYFQEPLSEEEAEFPIAYSILVYNHVAQVERLLRAIYMPQNVYCLHVDRKADPVIQRGLAAIAGCFDNVFIASRLESVFWGHISIIHAEMSCMEDLLRYRWKYFINLSGFMFPAHTNHELVRVLKLYDGANDIEGSFEQSNHLLFKVRYMVTWHFSTTLGMNVPLLVPKSQPLDGKNIKILKGSNQAVLTRAFVIYFLYSQEIRQLLDWFAGTHVPDEHFWSTINHNPQLHVPGSYKGDPETKAFTARATVWSTTAMQKSWSWSNWVCHGKWVRYICIYGIADLPWLYARPELFVNKFYADYQPLAYDCMEELIFNRTLAPHAEGGSSNYGESEFNTLYYLNLPFVANKSRLVVSLDETLAYLRAG